VRFRLDDVEWVLMIGRTALATLSLRCMSDLLAAVPHFNFSENIMGVLVGRIGRRSWDEVSYLLRAGY
jgi:nucleolar complex protein 3